MSDMTLQKAEDSLGLASTTSKEMSSLAYQMADDAKRKSDLVKQQYPTLGTPPENPLSPENAPRPSPSGQTPAQKKHAEETSKQIAQDKRDFAKNRKIIAEDRTRYKAASAVKAGSEDYEEAREFMKWAEKKYGKAALR